MTEVPLREYIETKIGWLDRHVSEQIVAIKEATKIALQTLDARLAGMNEFRDALKDQTARLATKDELIAANREQSLQREAWEKRLSRLENDQARSDGRASAMGATFGAACGAAASLAVALVVHWVTK